MAIEIDHVVLWAADPLASVAFYQRTLGFTGLRVDEFRERRVPFPSVRVSTGSIIDLMPVASAPMLNAIPGAAGSAGNKVNHLCFSMSRDELAALRDRLADAGTPVGFVMQDSFGAQGIAPEAFYFADPDGNILEARAY